MAFVPHASMSLSLSREPGENVPDVLLSAEDSSRSNWILDEICRVLRVLFGLRLGLHGVSFAFRSYRGALKTDASFGVVLVAVLAWA